jgi:hypothetical protein
MSKSDKCPECGHDPARDHLGMKDHIVTVERQLEQGKAKSKALLVTCNNYRRQIAQRDDCLLRIEAIADERKPLPEADDA